MEQNMFIGTNDKGLVIGDPSVLKLANPQDQESREMIVEQMVDGATAVPYVEEAENVVEQDTVSIPVVEAEPCM